MTFASVTETALSASRCGASETTRSEMQFITLTSRFVLVRSHRRAWRRTSIMGVMGTHGKAETEKLRKNLEDQLDRLVEQLADIEECRNTITPEEYEQMKDETMEQLKDFNDSLRRMISGDMTLVDELGAMQLATQSAIGAAFQTPEVIRMFGKREPERLRERLETVERDFKLGKLDKNSSESQQAEILRALKHLGQKMRPAELRLLERLSADDACQANFVPVGDSPEKGEIALAIASNEVRAAGGS